ncbi:MAG: FG-GAP repeat protein, partial [Candidatus Kapabacteria bacterium]|nr:FG-GAP repeat protein [Candidatus Kapabacteria bacterium]
GYSVSVNADGTTLAVGAPREDGSGSGINPTANNSVSNAGAAYVFVKNAGVWTQQAYIKARNNPRPSDEFGSCVDISNDGNTLVVGAPNEDGNGVGTDPGFNTSAPDAGAAFTYNRVGTVWSTGAYLKSTQSGRGDAFGRSVAIARDGGAIIVGCVGDDATTTCVNGLTNNGSTNVGSAQAYSRIGGQWIPSFLFRRLPTMSNGTDLRFGMVVDMDAAGRTVVVGTGIEDGSATGINGTMNNLRTNSGAVLTWTRN